jgi:hypothetical protein
VAAVVDEAVRMRAQATRVRAERVLRRLGVRVVARPAWRAVEPEPEAPPAPVAQAEDEGKDGVAVQPEDRLSAQAAEGAAAQPEER